MVLHARNPFRYDVKPSVVLYKALIFKMELKMIGQASKHNALFWKSMNAIQVYRGRYQFLCYVISGSNQNMREFNSPHQPYQIEQYRGVLIQDALSLSWQWEALTSNLHLDNGPCAMFMPQCMSLNHASFSQDDYNINFIYFIAVQCFHFYYGAKEISSQHFKQVFLKNISSFMHDTDYSNQTGGQLVPQIALQIRVNLRMIRVGDPFFVQFQHQQYLGHNCSAQENEHMKRLLVEQDYGCQVRYNRVTYCNFGLSRESQNSPRFLNKLIYKKKHPWDRTNQRLLRKFRTMAKSRHVARPANNTLLIATWIYHEERQIRRQTTESTVTLSWIEERVEFWFQDLHEKLYEGARMLGIPPKLNPAFGEGLPYLWSLK